jgi:hypothetical protein
MVAASTDLALLQDATHCIPTAFGIRAESALSMLARYTHVLCLPCRHIGADA